MKRQNLISGVNRLLIEIAENDVGAGAGAFVAGWNIYAPTERWAFDKKLVVELAPDV